MCGTVIQGGAEPEPGEQSVVTEGDFVLDDFTEQEILDKVDRLLTGDFDLEDSPL